MEVLRAFGGGAALLASMAMAVPVQAQRYQDSAHHGRDRDQGRGHHGHDRDKRDNTGGLVLGALVVGGLVALVAGEKKRRDRQAIYYADYQAPTEGDTATAYPPGSPVADIPAPNAAEYDGLYDEEAAQDRCAVAAEVQGQNYARLARVTAITEYRWTGRSWVVKGKLELASSYADTARPVYAFRCALKAGLEPVVAIAGLGPGT